MTDITGSWLGSYWQNGSATRFEATFVQANNAVSGRIADDGPQGEADISGDIIGRHIEFIKQYLCHPERIRYTGTISEDGNFMSGKWTIGPRHSGTWEAYRGEDEFTISLQKRLAKQTTLTGANR
ncbi:MAG: hypothetical protein VKJ64_09020 [Leptolyngbyaceae bacterium]|nr:hypothetical protein [Leptolyngbyaceae bacterium]